MTNLDPRTKIFLGTMAIAVVLLTRAPEIHGLEVFILFLVMVFRRMLRLWIRTMRLMGPMIALVFVIGLISFDIQTASLLSLRLFNLFTVSFVFFRSIAPEEIGDAMRKLGVPYEFSFILITSMRYVPLIGRRIRLIMEAQMSRGIDLRPRFRNIPNFVALLVPLLIQSFLLSEELAIAMESRGFGLKGRTFRRIYRITPKDIVLILFSLIFLAAFILLEVA